MGHKPPLKDVYPFHSFNTGSEIVEHTSVLGTRTRSQRTFQETNSPRG